ncbi:granzyme E [Notolabrus celidotus]|uniref:granzyme E n=1 Tax=Notolabrus celidotus TaxID=1203425 RepID=UPI00148FDC6C|nr:granzyme E [Notolabrus celidotus]
MNINCELVILILALTPYGQVHTGEIIGGHKVAPHKRPYMVLLENHQQNNGKTYCGAFILSEDFLMTAAHCKAKSHTAFLGSHTIRDNHEGITVEKAFPHEDYDASDCSNDIMLLKLSSKATFGENVKLIAVAGDDDGVLPQSCSVSGWGCTSWDDNHISRVLMELNVTLITSEMCPKDGSYCSEGENGPVAGDSGGPLVCEDEKAYGVVSAGKLTKDGLVFRKYTKISAYRSWIDGIMNNPGKP